MSRRTIVTVGPLAAASANAIATAQTLAGAGNVTLNGALVVGGVAVLDQPRRVIVTSAGNDSGITFTAYGTDWSGQPLQSLAIAGGNIAAVDFGLSFATITRIAASGATAGNITVGTNTIAESRPIFCDEFGYGPTVIQVNASGTVNYTVKSSQDNPNGDLGWGVPLGLQNCVWINHPDLVNQTISAQSSFTADPKLVQLQLNSGTGSLKLTLSQLASPAK